jgi:MFS family permease
MLATVPGGTLADRCQRARLLAIGQLVLGLLTATVWWLALQATVPLVGLLAYLACQGVVLGLSAPSFQTAIGDFTDESRLAKAINVNSGQAQLAKTIGPVLAGVVIAHFGDSWVFGINALSFFIAAVFLSRLRPTQKRTVSDHASLRLRDAAGQTFRHPTRRLAIVLAGVAMAIGTPVYSLLSVVAQDRLHVDADMYGVIVGMYGLGAVAGNLLNARLTVRRSRSLLAVLVMYGAGLATIGLSTSLWLTAAAVASVGCTYLLTSVILMTSVQLATPHHLRGRVVAIYSFAYVGAVPLGGLLAGYAATVAGIVSTLVASGVVMLTLAAWLASKPSYLARLDVERPEDIDLTTASTPVLSTAPRAVLT